MNLLNQHGRTVEITVNGRIIHRMVEPRMLLSDFLRDELGLTATHVGCEHGICGSCTVLVDGQAQRSCLQFAVSVNGHEVTTVEGLRNTPEFSRVATAFTANHAVQCGFCTPGIVASVMSELLAKESDAVDVDEMLGGHLCRCTGYVGLRAALNQIFVGRKVGEPG